MATTRRVKKKGDRRPSPASRRSSPKHGVDAARRIDVTDIATSPIFKGTAALDVQLNAGVRAVLSTPLVDHSRKLIGVFSAHFRSPHRPAEGTLLALDQLGRLTTEILERVQADSQPPGVPR
jgi:GAF domain-containing protein